MIVEKFEELYNTLFKILQYERLQLTSSSLRSEYDESDGGFLQKIINEF